MVLFCCDVGASVCSVAMLPFTQFSPLGKIHILTSVWSAQHPNAGQNIQHY